MLFSSVPTVLRIDGFRMSIFSNDHPPPHVHVFGAGCEALFYLNCPSGPPTLRANYGFSERELRRIRGALSPHVKELCIRWEEIYDKR